MVGLVIAVIPRLRKKVLASGLPQDFKRFQPLMVDLVIAVIPRLRKKVLASGLPQD